MNCCLGSKFLITFLRGCTNNFTFVIYHVGLRWGFNFFFTLMWTPNIPAHRQAWTFYIIKNCKVKSKEFHGCNTNVRQKCYCDNGFAVRIWNSKDFLTPCWSNQWTFYIIKIVKSKVKNFTVVISMSVKNVIAIMVSLSESETPKIFFTTPCWSNHTVHLTNVLKSK